MIRGLLFFLSCLLLSLLIQSTAADGSQPKKRVASSVVYSWTKASTVTNTPEAKPTDLVSSFFRKVNLTMICAGQSHSGAVDNEGTVFMWGLNDVSQLGDGTTISKMLPNPVYSQTSDPLVSQLSCGQKFNLMLRRDGTLYAWGENKFGQLGDGTTTNRHTPVPVKMDGVLSGRVITRMATGGTHSLVLTRDGRMFAWGENDEGKLGDGTITNAIVPVAVDMSELDGKVVIQIAASFYHSVALTSDGTVYFWGVNILMDGEVLEAPTPMAIDLSNILQEGSIVTQISVGHFHTVMLTNDSKIFAWGANHYGQLGNPSFSESLEPVAVDMSGELSGKTVVRIAAGAYHTLALTSDGLLYGWGRNLEGQLDSTLKGHIAPALLEVNHFMNMTNSITHIVAGEAHTIVLTSKGKGYSWGKNEEGQLGNGVKEESSNAVAIGMNGALKGKIITSIVAKTRAWGSDHFVALTRDGNIYAWGLNEAGEIGDGTKVPKPYPVMIDRSGIMNDRTISQSTVGVSFTVVRAEDGALYSWGTNGRGQLGDDSFQERHQPVAVFMGGVLSNKTITTVSAGGFHVVAIASDGMVYAWGRNSGALGDGTTQDRKSPVLVKGSMEGKTVVQMAASSYHTVALTSEGTLYAWGSNRCDLPTIERDRYIMCPKEVAMNTTLKNKNITHLTAGDCHTTVLTSEGQIYSWGLTDFGAPIPFEKMPVQVSMNGLLNGKIVSQFAVNDDYMLALTSDRKLGYWDFKRNYSSWVRMNKVDSKQDITSLFVGADSMGFLGVACERGYYGQDCQLFNCYDTESEDRRVCSGNGLCIDLDTCDCQEGFTGMNCSYPLCHGYSSVDQKVCSSHGTCQRPNQCACNYGYQGDTCSSNLKPLWTLPVLGAIMCLSIFVTAVVIGLQIRRQRRKERMKSELRACLLEEMGEYEDTSFDRGDFFIDMTEIKLISRISEGAFGVVFKGEWKSNSVAVKKMKVSDDESFVKEVSILQSLRHPNILYLYGYSSNDSGDKFLITEYAMHGSLDKVLHKGNQSLKDFDQKMNILTQIADTMAYLHGRSPRIVHRDLKPQNILLGDNYHVRICDFGLSKSTDTSFTIGKSYGTIEYCAPELLSHQEHDESCDIYSFGIVMHELFTLAAPYSQHSYSSVFTLGLDIVRGLRPFTPSNDPQALLHFFSQSNTMNIASSDIPSIVQDFYSLATRCWDADATKRPSFKEITTELDAIKLKSE